MWYIYKIIYIKYQHADRLRNKTGESSLCEVGGSEKILVDSQSISPSRNEGER